MGVGAPVGRYDGANEADGAGLGRCEKLGAVDGAIGAAVGLTVYVGRGVGCAVGGLPPSSSPIAAKTGAGVGAREYVGAYVGSPDGPNVCDGKGVGLTKRRQRWGSSGRQQRSAVHKRRPRRTAADGSSVRRSCLAVRRRASSILTS